jgi:hypothetical protein
MQKRLFTILFLLFGCFTISQGQLISFGGGLEQSIDILQAPRQNSALLYNVSGNGFTLLPMANFNLNDNTSISLQTGGGLSFMSKNNSSGEVDKDVLFTVPIGAKVSFGSASNTGKECGIWGWWLGAGRQWRSGMQIHGTITESYTTYYGEVGGTINANDPMAIGAYFRFGAGSQSAYGMQLGLSVTFNYVADAEDNCN